MQLVHETHQNVLVIKLSHPQLDAKDAPRFKEEVLGIVEKQQQHKLVFDLAALQFIDSSGLGSFLSLLRVMNGKGGDLKLAEMSPNIRALFEMVRMHKLFEIYPSTHEAILSYEQPR